MYFMPMRRPHLIVLGVVSVAALIALLAVNCSVRDTVGNPVQAVSDVTDRHIEYRFSLQNDSTRVMESAQFWTYGPVTASAAQNCTGLIANHPYELSVDHLGNQILHFTFNKLPPFVTKMIHIQADVELLSSPGKIRDVNLDVFLEPENRIESNRPEILALARQLKRMRPSETVKSIFRWVSENIRYSGFHGADRGALYAFRNRQGDCTEYMSLFIALCRANGIPARGVGGYICAGDSILKPANYHNWAEFYEGEKWHPVDPQRRIFGSKELGCVAMRIIGRSAANPMGELPRFRSVGEEIKVRMES
jgi:hypothetical protein